MAIDVVAATQELIDFIAPLANDAGLSVDSVTRAGSVTETGPDLRFTEPDVFRIEIHPRRTFDWGIHEGQAIATDEHSASMRTIMAIIAYDIASV